MSALIVTVLKLLGSIVSGGLLFQAFVASHHAKPITKIAGIVVSLVTLSMFFIDIKDVLPASDANKTEQIYWESVEKHPSPQTYQHYLMEYPKGKFVAIARAQLANYTAAVSMPSDKEADLTDERAKSVDETVSLELKYWEIVEKQPSLDAYRAYLQRYPSGKFVDIARSQLSYYTQRQLPAHVAAASSQRIDEADKTEQLYWHSIESHPSAELYQDYLNKYPTGKFVTRAQTQLNHYEKAKARSVQKPTQKTAKPGDWKTIGRFYVNQGLVKDSKTGLMWMRCSMGQEWQEDMCQGVALGYSWKQATELSGHFEYADYHDWRVPTHEELKSLVYCSSGQFEVLALGRSVCGGDYVSPTLRIDVFPATPDGWFWSSSPDVRNSGTAWGVNFNDGYDGWDFKYSDNRIRLVRRM